MIKNDSALFYTCSLIEYIGRDRKLERADVVNYLGKEIIDRIYRYSDVLHCEPIESVAYRYIEKINIPSGEFDNVSDCRYEVPDYWTIGEVYERLIEDISQDNVVENIIPVYNSWISRTISNYNSDFFYQSRDYISACYAEGKILVS